MNSDTKLPFLILAMLVALISNHEVKILDLSLAFDDKIEMAVAKSYSSACFGYSGVIKMAKMPQWRYFA